MRSHVPNSFIARLRALASGSGVPRLRSFTAEQVGRNVRLEFPQLTISRPSIHWHKNFNLHVLFELSRSALSGPVQEDKAAAYAFLKHIVKTKETFLDSFDLRDIYGISIKLPEILPYETLEEICALESCRSIRLISLSDFERLMARIMPSSKQSQPVQLYSAPWLGKNYFWEPEPPLLEFISAVVYARRRGLPIVRSARLLEPCLNKKALEDLQQSYHMLALPSNAWSESTFMPYLVNYRVPYARLTAAPLLKPFELLLLPRTDVLSDELGKGLRIAGARDATTFLLKLCEQQDRTASE